MLEALRQVYKLQVLQGLTEMQPHSYKLDRGTNAAMAQISVGKWRLQNAA